MSEKNEELAESEKDEKSVAADSEAGAVGTGADSAPEAEPKPAARPVTRRQWIVMRNASMDLRVGRGILAELAKTLRSGAGRPHACALVHDGMASEEVVETLRRNLCDQGFDVRLVPVSFSACDLAAVGELCALLEQARVTSDDVVVATGAYETLSVASYACSSWCGGVSLAEVPLDVCSAVIAAVSPRGLDVPGFPRALQQEGSARYTVLDVDLFDLSPEGEELRGALAHMAQTAACDSDKAFGTLWDASEGLVAGDPDAVVEQLRETLKSRGKVCSASSAALRQSIAFGTTFQRALLAVSEGAVSPAVALADGMRFASRLAVAQGVLPIESMFTIDDLLDRLGLPTTSVAVDPEALAAALKEERYRRTNRFMLAVPRAIGRVRLAVIEDDLLAEHVAAWCASRPLA